jgi:two-component system cell cycle sensor histidine kinase/response regulator CckA
MPDRSNRFAEAILDTAHEALVCVDDDLRVIAASSPFFDRFHLARKQVLGARLPHLAEGRWDVPELSALVEKARDAGSGVHRARLQLDLGAGPRELLLNARAFTPDGRPAKLVLIAFDDITDRVNAEARCAHLTSVVGFSRDAIISWGLDGNVTTWNQGAERLYGYSAGEMIGQSIARLTPNDRPTDFAELVRRIRDGEQLDAIEAVRQRQDGRLVHVSLSLAPMRDEDGTIIGATGVSRDITARVAIERALNRTIDQLQAVISNVPMLLWVVNWDGRILLSEGRLLKKLGLKPGELVGQNQLELYKHRADALEPLKRALLGEQVQFTFEEHDVIFDTWFIPMKVGDGAIQGVIGIGLDVTERVRLEEQFRQAQKMEAVGRLAGGIAHDFNNLLTAILGYAEMAIENLPADDPLSADICQIHKAGVSASGLTRQLLAFSRRQMLKPEVIDINTIIRRMELLLHRVVGEQIVIRTTLGDNLGHTSADPAQIEQVILNLAVNARDAMPAGGELSIETSNAELTNAFASSHVGAQPGPHVMLRVSDTGAGIEERAMKQVFEPFFTTKHKSRGTGLGLATVYGIVKQSGGSIWVDSVVGKGATFTVYLPTSTAPLTPVVTSTTSAAARAATEVILLVEDQDDVRRVAASILRHAGYRVIETGNPRTALTLAQDLETQFDLLLTDVVMPEMTGRELAKGIVKHRSNLPVLYTSGYAEDAIVERGVLDPGLAFVAKPFTAQALLHAVRKTLDASVTPSA